MSEEKRIELSIHGQVFRLRCPEGEEEKLRSTAELVESRINEIVKSGTMADSLRVALMAAFHFAYELVSREEGTFRHSAEYRKIQKRLKALVKQIDTNLSQ